MTRRKQPKNKTIVKEAWEKIEGTDKMTKTVKEDGYTLTFIFPNDLDRIQPDHINGNLTIKFPE
jgi:hypothetical protein